MKRECGKKERGVDRYVAIVTLLVVGVLLITTGCAALAPQRLSLPRTDAGRHLEIEFTSALNLLPGARVTVNGVKVGSVENIDLRTNSVLVRAGLDDAARLTTTSRATLTQDTLLGDVYVAITAHPGDPAVDSRDSTTYIPLGRTVPQAPVEDMLSVLANYVGTGAFTRLLKAGQEVRKVVAPYLSETPGFGSRFRQQVRELADATGDLDRILDAGSGVSSIVRQRQGEIAHLLDPRTLRSWQRLTFALSSVVVFIGAIGPFARDAYWLMPLLNSASDTITSATAAGISLVSGTERLNNFIREFLVPFTLNPRVNVTSATNSPKGTDTAAVSITSVLRILGAVR